METGMNLAIEHMIRTRSGKNLLKMPCSIFLSNIENDNKLAITIQNCYGRPNEIVVKHWNLTNISKDRILPHQEEFVVDRNHIFDNSLTILDDFCILDYTSDPYPIIHKQNPDEPYASAQERQYTECLERFFNCYNNDLNKLNWLWSIFVRHCFPETCATDFGKTSCIQQRDVIRNLCPIVWKGWQMWEKYMFFDSSSSKISAELIFSPYYQEKLSKNSLYQQKKKSKITIKASAPAPFISFYDVPSIANVDWQWQSITDS
jgi:hypothetical protein